MKILEKHHKTTLERLLELISFNSYIHELTDRLNRRVKYSQIYQGEDLSHPGGYIQGLRKRRLGIAEAFLAIVYNPEPADFKIRLKALKTLIEMGFYAKSLAMPLNTARVQIAMIKEAIRYHGNFRKQMEIMAEFSEASHGRAVVIRKYLLEHGLVEVPEKDLPLKDLNLGWDSHVHDNLTEGRKTPTQLILDAFIKGISCLTLVHYDLTNTDIIYESLTAGKLLGIKITLALEFSIGKMNRRRHYMYVLPYFETVDSLKEFEEQWQVQLATFFAGLAENGIRKTELIANILEKFNETHLLEINEGWDDLEIFGLKPLTLASFETMIYGNQYSRLHVRDLLYQQLEKIQHKRLLTLKTHYETTRQLFHLNKKTSWELQRIREEYEKSKKQYYSLTRQGVEDKYLPLRNKVDYDSVFKNETIFADLQEAGGKIVFIHPLTCGMATTMENLLVHHQFIDGLELLNMDDSANRSPEELIELAEFVKSLNAGNREQVVTALARHNVVLPKKNDLSSILEYYRKTPLICLCSSDSKARNPGIPGMGYIRFSKIPKKARKAFSHTHIQIPQEIANLVDQNRPEPQRGSSEDENSIYSLGKSNLFNEISSLNNTSLSKIKNVWKYLNPGLKQLIRIGIAAIPALWMVGPVYTAIWFGITFFRNIIVDMIAATGLWPINWRSRDVDYDNASQSLFWTGFSVPLLGYVKIGYDTYLHQFMMNHPLFSWAAETVKFFFICLANGLYISSHNTLRGFDRSVVRGNLFRSVLAWPFASLFAPIGNLMGVPSIVQAKFWSDVVAGFIEGAGKITRHFNLCHRDILEILPEIFNETETKKERAILDILYIWGYRHRGKSAMNLIMWKKQSLIARVISWFKPIAYDELEAEETRKLRIELQEKFTSGDHLRDLTDFSLQNYPVHEAEYLMDIIIEQYGKFAVSLDKNNQNLESEENQPVD